MFKKEKWILFIFLIAASFSQGELSPKNASYQLASLSVSPSRTFLKVIPGKGYEGFWILKNTSVKPIKITLLEEDWTELGANKKVGKPDSWLKIPLKEISLQPQEEKKITYKIRLSRGMKGEKLAQVFFDPAYLSDEGSFLHTRTGVLVIAVAKNTEKIELGNFEFKVVTQEKTGKSHLDFKMDNLGNVHTKWKALIDLWFNGKKIESFVLQPPQSILTGESKHFSAPIKQKDLPSEGIKAKTTLCYGLENDSDLKKEFTIPVTIKKE